jgi:hypothetical protein
LSCPIFVVSNVFKWKFLFADNDHGSGSYTEPLNDLEMIPKLKFLFADNDHGFGIPKWGISYVSIRTLSLYRKSIIFTSWARKFHYLSLSHCLTLSLSFFFSCSLYFNILFISWKFAKLSILICIFLCR